MNRRPRRRRVSLRTRLTLIYGGMFLVAGVVLLGVTYALFSNQLTGVGTKVYSNQRLPGPVSTAPSASPDATPSATPDNLVVITADGKRLTGPAAERWMRAQQRGLRAAATSSLITQGGIALLVVGAAAAGFGWLVAGRVLAPLHRVTETARRIAGAPAADRGLHERIALRGPHDEVKDLADTFDTMVERLDRSFDGQRRFVANASHELRTPLTLGRALVEVALHRESASADVRQLGENLLEINSRHERLIDGLLLLAGSDQEIAVRSPLDLADVVEHVTARAAAEARAAGVTLTATTSECPTTGDALLLERLVHNLVENGIRHNAGPGGWVRVSCHPESERIVLEVSNTGPTVPPYEIPSLFDPFRRLGGDRLVSAKGAGLGLSIVRSVATAHGGEVTATSRTTGGLTVRSTLPSDLR
ncbi:sensor histidine kinase [Streptomyces sp. NPDC059897]|uniref:sensor histidine kinase n=1 Tax=Streptomyces sp. NPDC059897 TaxID=3346994 RepID=UPI00365E25FF